MQQYESRSSSRQSLQLHCGRSRQRLATVGRRAHCLHFASWQHQASMARRFHCVCMPSQHQHHSAKTLPTQNQSLSLCKPSRLGLAATALQGWLTGSQIPRAYLCGHKGLHGWAQLAGWGSTRQGSLELCRVHGEGLGAPGHGSQAVLHALRLRPCLQLLLQCGPP